MKITRCTRKDTGKTVAITTPVQSVDVTLFAGTLTEKTSLHLNRNATHVAAHSYEETAYGHAFVTAEFGLDAVTGGEGPALIVGHSTTLFFSVEQARALHAVLGAALAKVQA